MVAARNACNACNSASCQCCICMRVNRVKKPTRLSGSKIKTFKGQRQTIVTTKSHISYYMDLSMKTSIFFPTTIIVSIYSLMHCGRCSFRQESFFYTRFHPCDPSTPPPPHGLADPARQQFITLIGSPAGGDQSMRLSGWSEALQEEGRTRGGREPACQARERDIQLSLVLCPRYRV